ncbi:MAG: DUF4272 domain-containing protein [Oscillospiraceae bacterium]|nr:DUF4272 domain-containing protein [Oscillospiraceae bacterium]
MEFKTPEQRKEESIKIIKENSIEVFEGLPVIENYEETILRSKEEIAQRAIALCIFSVYAEGVCIGEDVGKTQELVNEVVKRYNAETFFTEKEKEFLNNPEPTREEAIVFSWQYECYTVLLWALGLVDSLDFPNQICDVSKVVGMLTECKNYEEFEEKSEVRNKEEILDQADLIYRYNWACVDARIHNKTIKNIDSGVVFERHRALNWLINYMDQGWDDVTTDT